MKKFYKKGKHLFRSYIALWKKKKTRPYVAVGTLVAALLLVRIAGATGGDVRIDTQQEKRVRTINIAETVAAEDVISASGEVEAKDQVELRSEVSARVAQVYIGLGEEVRAGQTLVVFQNGESVSQRTDAVARVQAAQAVLEQIAAQVDAQKTRLAELERGARPEELSIAQAALSNAELALKSAQSSFDAAENKADEDFNNTLKASAASLLKSVQSAKDVLFVATTIQYDYFAGNQQDDLRIVRTKEAAINTLYGVPNAGKWESGISTLRGDLINELTVLAVEPNEEKIRDVAGRVQQGYVELAIMLDSIPFRDLSVTEVASLTAEKSRVQGELVSITAATGQIDVQRAANDSAIQAADSALTSARNGYISAEEQLNLVKAGATNEQLDAQKAAVAQAEASLRAQQAQLLSAEASVGLFNAQVGKTIVTSPISGKVSVLPVKVGELVSPGEVVASVVNTDGLQIQAYVDSTQLQALSIGAPVDINGTATGTVSFISPAIDPQTRKVELGIVVTGVNELRPLVVGEFATLKIQRNQTAGNSIQAIIPLEAIYTTTEGAFVFMADDESVAQAIPVSLGSIRGTSVEVIAGLEETTTIFETVRGIERGQKVEVIQ